MATPEELALRSDSDIMSHALKLAKLQAFKNLYLKDIRHNPEKYLEGAACEAYHDLADRSVAEKEKKHASCFVLTYNPPHLEDELAIKFFRSMVRALAKWKWVKGFAYVIERAPGTRRPHLHMVIQQSAKRYPSEIHRQVWVWLHNAYNTENYPFVNTPGHNRQHLDIRPILNGREGIINATEYLQKDEERLCGPYRGKDTTYLYKHFQEASEKTEE